MTDDGFKADRSDGRTNVIAPDNEEAIAFIKTLLANGQAAKALPDGSLPPGVTHEIIGKAPSGLPIVRRRRMSIF